MAYRNQKVLWDDEASNNSTISSKFDLSALRSNQYQTPLIANNNTVVATDNNVYQNSEKKKSVKKPLQTIPHHKAGRVKVGVRCRPPFESEMKSTKDGGFVAVVYASDSEEGKGLGKIQLTMSSGRQREFLYDYAFNQAASQSEVYERIALPVVTDVLRGFNGTIFAYGQTGTGKTYTMGILESVTSQNAGIIPRAISQIFQYVHSISTTSDTMVTVTMSFLQIYRENIQDLLSSSVMQSLGGQNDTNATYPGVYEENLCIREDPRRGFYVEGLQEYTIRNYGEAEALLNVGLEYRAIAPTLMNSTSSRSHTVLTLYVEQRGNNFSDDMKPNSRQSVDTSTAKQPGTYLRTLRSKLLLVDLAGSERVRKTISKGTRLDEAKSINTSLSALGNVIAALAEPNATHIPYRDSKLTRILTDSLGGTASTALIATVGPSSTNYNETLSTLQFASRCMSIKSAPVLHEELDYANLCIRLQEQLSTIESDMNNKINEQKIAYDNTIFKLREQVCNV